MGTEQDVEDIQNSMWRRKCNFPPNQPTVPDNPQQKYGSKLKENSGWEMEETMLRNYP